MSRSHFVVFGLALLNGLLLLILVSQYTATQIGFPTGNTRYYDAREYHFVAVNMLEGRGYFDVPVAPAEAYDEWTRQQFVDWFESSAGAVVSTSQIAQVTPGYPLFLAAIYRLHGVSLEIVVFYQHILIFGIGMLMLVIGWQMWRYIGAAAATAAVFLLGMNIEFSYMVTQIMTETLAAFFVILGLSVSLWAKRRDWGAEGITGLIFGLAILIKPALVFTALLYALFLLFGATGGSKQAVMRRAAAYAVSCTLLLSTWVGIASYLAGGPPPLVDYGLGAVKRGIREGTPLENGGGLISIEELRARDLGAEFTQVLHDPRPMMRHKLVQFKESLERLPRFLWNSILLGFALLGAAVITAGPAEANAGTGAMIRAAPLGRGLFGSRPFLLGVLFLSILLLYAIGMGWSAPWVQLWFMVLPLLMLLARVEFSTSSPEWFAIPVGEYRWVLSWLVGFLAIVILTIGRSRYMRPFLPEFYLAAAFALPLLVMWLSALLELKSRFLNLEFEWARRV